MFFCCFYCFQRQMGTGKGWFEFENLNCAGADRWRRKSGSGLEATSRSCVRGCGPLFCSGGMAAIFSLRRMFCNEKVECANPCGMASDETRAAWGRASRRAPSFVPQRLLSRENVTVYIRPQQSCHNQVSDAVPRVRDPPTTTPWPSAVDPKQTTCTNLSVHKFVALFRRRFFNIVWLGLPWLSTRFRLCFFFRPMVFVKWTRWGWWFWRGGMKVLVVALRLCDDNRWLIWPPWIIQVIKNRRVSWIGRYKWNERKCELWKDKKWWNYFAFFKGKSKVSLKSAFEWFWFDVGFLFGG